ncbi:hypothetical protein GCM10009795_047480 [Nocardioides hankookensis]|uniref:Nuclear transport factor 2 family protein n=1 Tax=Nocardioides hankookensis TaxID=443157 RepID=A0ABW1LEL2_9ACTN
MSEPVIEAPSAAGVEQALALARRWLPAFDGGWVVQATAVGTNAAGEPVRVPSCQVVTLRDGRIALFEEYADSRAAEALFG